MATLPSPPTPVSRLDQLMKELLEEGEKQKKALLEEGRKERERMLREAEEAAKSKSEELTTREQELKKNAEKAHKKLLAEAKMVGEEVKKASGKIKLDVGGKKFSTTHTTLCTYPQSMLAAMFSGRHELHPDEDGFIFIDRDGDLFTHILRWLRSGVVDMDNLKPSELTLLKKEAEYYGLPMFSPPAGGRKDSLEGVSFPKLLERLRQHEQLPIETKKTRPKSKNPVSNVEIEALVQDMIDEQTVVLAKEFNARLEEEKEEKLRLVSTVKAFVIDALPRLVTCAVSQHIAATKKRVLRSLDIDFQPHSSAPSSIETCETPTHPTPDVRAALGDAASILSSVSIVFAPALDTLITQSCSGYDSQVRQLFSQKTLDLKNLDSQTYSNTKNFVLDDAMYTALSFRMTRALLLNDLKDNHDLSISITCINCRLICHGRYSSYKWSMGYESDNQYRQCGRNTICYEIRLVNPNAKEGEASHEGADHDDFGA